MRYLLTLACDVNHQNAVGHSALLETCCKPHHVEIAEILLCYGANTEARDEVRVSPT